MTSFQELPADIVFMILTFFYDRDDRNSVLKTCRLVRNTFISRKTLLFGIYSTVFNIIYKRMLSDIENTRGMNNRIEKFKPLLSYTVNNRYYFDKSKPESRKNWETTFRQKLKQFHQDFDCNEYALGYFGKPVKEL